MTTVKMLGLRLLGLLPTTLIKALPVGKLVNADRVRGSVKRMFRNSADELLAELFQNSMRAGAKRVTITTREGGFTVSDDGGGVDGVTGFQALLKIAETKFDPARVSEMQPMGIGLGSLYSHDLVTSVTFRSGNVELTIDTKRWFDDEQYATTWFQNLRTLARRTPGLTISVACDAQLVEQVRQALKPKDSKGAFSPAQGYGGLLEFELDGEPVETRLPRWAAMAATLVETAYEGSRLVIGISSGSSTRNSSTVNWYGQLIPVDFPGAFDFHLVVRGGTPVDPRSPTREGLIDNGRLHALFDFVRERIFEFLFDTANFTRIEPEWIAAAYQLDEARSLRDCPYFVASTLLPLTPEDIESVGNVDVLGDSALFRYDNEPSPLLLAPGVSVDWAGTDEAEHGLASFLGMTGPAYRLAHGDRHRLRVGLLFWRPGERTGEIFYERGEWGVGYDGFAPAEWHPVTADHVFAFNQAACWDISHAEDLFVGTANALDFLRTLAFVAWSDDSDASASYNELHESYDASVDAMIRRLIGNCVSPYFTLQDLAAFLPAGAARVETIKVIYPEGEGSATAVSVTSTTGETVELRLVA